MRKVTTTESEIVQFRQDVQTKLRQRVREAIETVLDEELAAALGCEAPQRCKGRRGYRNGSGATPADDGDRHPRHSRAARPAAAG